MLNERPPDTIASQLACCGGVRSAAISTAKAFTIAEAVQWTRKCPDAVR